MPRTKSTVSIENVVASSSVNLTIDLNEITEKFSHVEYHPEQFPGLVLRVKEPKSAVLVFSSGNLVCTGTKSIAQVKQVIEQVIKILKKINITITDKPKITVQNIVASGSIDMMLNLNYLSLELENTEYEPEQFPGLVYKLEDPPATFLLFSNGKLVCTGTKNNKQLKESMRQLVKTLKEIKSRK